MDSIFSFSREVSREGRFDFSGASGGGHGIAGGGGGLAGGCGGGIVGGGAVVDGVVVGTTEDTMVTRGVTGGKGLVPGTLG